MSLLLCIYFVNSFSGLARHVRCGMLQGKGVFSISRLIQPARVRELLSNSHRVLRFFSPPSQRSYLEPSFPLFPQSETRRRLCSTGKWIQEGDRGRSRPIPSVGLRLFLSTVIVQSPLPSFVTCVVFPFVESSPSGRILLPKRLILNPFSQLFSPPKNHLFHQVI